MHNKTLAAVLEHARREYPRECCGLIIVRRGRERYVPCRNTAIGSEHFILPGEDFAAAEEQGTVMAVVHSHPDAPATPSQADRVSCEASGLPWHIVRVDRAELDDHSLDLQTIEPSGYQAPLVGREFAHGVLDCYALVRDWYRIERGIVLPDFERRDDWWLTGENLYLDNFRAAGFEPVADGAPLKVGDGILMQVRSPQHPNHAGVYIDEGFQWMLHHAHGRLSTREVYGGYWREVTRLVVRHKDLA